jgi:putative hydrolase
MRLRAEAEADRDPPSMHPMSNFGLPGSGGDDPFGDDNPFKGMPIFGDLAKLFQQQGPVNWDAARQLALSIAVGDETESNVDPLDRIKIEQLARVADLQVANATGLSTSITGRGVTVMPVTRSQWAQRTLDAYKPLFELLAGSLQQDDTTPADDPSGGADPMAWMAPLMQMIGPTMLGMTAGSMVGHLARRSFGQYDLPIPRPPTDELTIVTANLDSFGREWSLPVDDLRLWVCLHEIATHAILGVPHVRDAIDALLRDYLAGFQTDSNSLESRMGEMNLDDPSDLAGIQSLLGDPETLLGAIQSPGQRDLLPRLEALVTVIVGVVDHTMDKIGAGLISSYGMVTEAVRRRRVEDDQSDRFVERLFGLELTQTQYDRGTVFASGVVERAGDDGLARLWHSARNLPTPAEVDAPGLWLARIDLPTDLPD